MSNFLDQFESFDDYREEFFTKHPELFDEYKKGLIEDYEQEKEIKLEDLFSLFEDIMELESSIKGLPKKVFKTSEVLSEIDRIASGMSVVKMRKAG